MNYITRRNKYYEHYNRFCMRYDMPPLWNTDITQANVLGELIKTINAVIKEVDRFEGSVNDIIKEMNDLILAFIEAFDGELETTVENKLTEWLDSGVLEGIINEALFNMKLDKTEFNDFKVEIENKVNYSDIIRLSDFGVYDSDITSVLNQAIQHMNENTGKTLLLPSGNYYFNDSVILKDTKGSIVGVGKESTVINFKGVGNAFEIGYINAVGDSWDLGYTTVIDLKDFTLKSESSTTKNGLVIHTIGSTVDSLIIEGFTNGHGMLAKQLGYFNVLNTIFKLNKVGVYAYWSIYFNNCKIANNHLVGVFLGGACKMESCLIEWQKPTTGFNPNTRLINIITFNGSSSKSSLTNCYVEHDHVHVGYDKMYDIETLSFIDGFMGNASTSFNGCTFSDQPIIKIYSGIIELDGNRFNGGNFGVDSGTPYSKQIPENYIKPKVILGLTNANVNINRMGGGNYISINKAPSILKNTTFDNDGENKGTNTKTYNFKEELSLVSSLWENGDFNVDLDIKISDNSWDLNPVLSFKNYKQIKTIDFPRLVYEFVVEEGVDYFVSFNGKTTDIMLYTAVSESGIEYLQTDFKVGTLNRRYDAFSSGGVWSRRMKSFTATKTEKVSLIFNTESKSIGKGFEIQSVSVSTIPGKL